MDQPHGGLNRQSAGQSRLYPDSLESINLEWLIKLINPQPDWRTLDIATICGDASTKYATGTVKTILTADNGPDRLQRCWSHHQEKETQSTPCVLQDTQYIPFPTAYFNLITCYMAAHRFDNIPAFVVEAYRVLQPGGFFVVAATIVDGEPAVAEYINTIERYRDTAHVWCYSVLDWQSFLSGAGFTIIHTGTRHRRINLDEWTGVTPLTEEARLRLQALFFCAPNNVATLLQPIQAGACTFFTLTEGMFVAGKKGHKIQE
nr:methyltransferase domain-containing protein [Anaerolineae bacterium]